MNDLTGFQRDLLRVIGGKDSPIGLEVKSEVEDYYNKEVNHGRLYPNLDTLVNKGFVNKEEVDGRSNSYTLTAAGRSALQERDEFNKSFAPDATAEPVEAE